MCVCGYGSKSDFVGVESESEANRAYFIQVQMFDGQVVVSGRSDTCESVISSSRKKKKKTRKEKRHKE